MVARAQRLAAFDFFAVTIRLGPAGGAARAHVEGPLRHLRIDVPPDAGPVDADALLAALGDAFAWDAVGPWWPGWARERVARALARDLAKVDALEDALGVACRRLELLAGAAAARAARTGEPWMLTPSEAEQARSAQWAATFALQRLVNTIARWRPALASDARGFPFPDDALLVSARAGAALEGHLGWLLDVIVGGRAVLAVWASSWRHRNPLYKVLDARAEVGLEAGGAARRLPAGAVRGLIALRLEGGLWSWVEEVDARLAARGEAARLGPLADAAPAARARHAAAGALAARRRFSAPRAWKELWDARLKEGAALPIYEAVAAIGTFLGDTRVRTPPPALRGAALEAFARAHLRPGDIVVVRQEHFLSNAFLPGFWPHALLWLGAPEDWSGLRLPDGTRLGDDPAGRAALGAWRARDGHPPRVLEATSDGVELSSLEHALGKDHLVVLRPALDEPTLAACLRRALACLGRPYDFDFDFATDDRLVCTELVYRGFDPELNFRVRLDASAKPPVPGLVEVMGRVTMPAGELVAYALHMADAPAPDPSIGYPGRRLEVVAFVEPDGAGGARVEADPERARARLRATLSR